MKINESQLRNIIKESIKKVLTENNISNELIKRDNEERNSVCPYVPESELRNLPKDTYVVMDGEGRDYHWNIRYSYSGHAGTKEQCIAFVERYYDKHANWEFLPKIVSLEEYFNIMHNKH